eukprot:6211276-Pleurochrysis_carterae.AAC.2
MSAISTTMPIEKPMIAPVFASQQAPELCTRNHSHQLRARCNSRPYPHPGRAHSERGGGKASKTYRRAA